MTGYRKEKLPPTRQVAIDAAELGQRRHYVHGLVQPDVTRARAEIRRLREAGTRVSFTGWIMKCLADAAGQFPEVNALRKGRRLYIFERVHVGLLIEVESAGRRVPVPYLVRDCHAKSVREITDEIDAARAGGAGGEMVIANERAARLARLSLLMPARWRRVTMKLLLRNPVRAHNMMGALGVTAVGMFGPSGGWPIIIPGGHALALAVGGIETGERERLDLTVSFDHDVIDGAPAARFTKRLMELLEEAYGLSEI